MLRIEATDSFSTEPDLDIEGFSEEDIVYNLDLLISGGLVHGSSALTLNGTHYVTIKGLTWDGHDFLDSVRDPSVWQATEAKAETAGHKITDLTFDVVKALAVSIVTENLGI